MILHVEIPLPDGWEVGPQSRVRSVVGGEVRDPSVGFVGNVVFGRLDWRDGGVFLEVSLDLDDSQVGRSLRAPRPTF